MGKEWGRARGWQVGINWVGGEEVDRWGSRLAPSLSLKVWEVIEIKAGGGGQAGENKKGRARPHFRAPSITSQTLRDRLGASLPRKE